MKLRGKEIYIIAGVVAAVLVVAWFFLLFQPKRSDVADLNSQIGTTQTTLDNTKQEIVRLESYKKAAPQSRAEIVRLGKMLPSSEGVPSLLIELSQTAHDSGVTLTNISRSETTPGNKFGIQTVTLVAEGKYFDLEDFFYRLENYVVFRNSSFRVTGRLLQVTGLSVASASDSSTSTTSGSPTLTANVTIDAYLWGGSSTSTTSTAGGAQ